MSSYTNSILKFLNTARARTESVDIEICSEHRRGIIQVRNGKILSAHSGILYGNGAILTLAQLEDLEIKPIPSDSPAQKTVQLSLNQIEHLISAVKAQAARQTPCDEESLLEKARLQFFRFKYEQAFATLSAILRYNHFFYPAWLWKSRILTRHDHIGKVLEEAYRWGNHDHDIWREARKIRPQLNNNATSVRRCMFCWSILGDSLSCNHCSAHLTITGQPVSTDLKKHEIDFALGHMRNALKQDSSSGRTAYGIAIGCFNLDDLAEAHAHMQLAVKLTPRSTAYQKSFALLRSMLKTHTTKKEVHSVSTAPARQEPDRPAILVVEDSPTSRKVLSLLFNRQGYSVIEAASGAEALARARNRVIDAVLLDLVLPDTSGHDLLPKLRQIVHLRDTPVVMITGRHNTTDRVLGLQRGVEAYVTKPFNTHKLTSLVQELTEKKLKNKLVRKNGNVISPRNSVPVPSILPVNGDDNIPPPLPASRSAPSPRNSTSKSIFVIEDSQTSRKVLSMILQRNGFHIYEAATGREALDLARDIHPNLVLLDVMLPDMTGYKVLPRLKNLPHFKDLPVIMLTGKNAPVDKMKGILAGADVYLTKPFNPAKLLSVIGCHV